MFSETRRKVQEADAHAQETGRKLQVLMDAVNSEDPCLRPITYPCATTYASQQTTSAQRRFRLHQSCHGRNNPQAFGQPWTQKTQSKTTDFISKIFILNFVLSFSDFSCSRFAMVSTSDHVMYSKQMMMAPSAAETIQRADQTVSVKVTYK